MGPLWLLATIALLANAATEGPDNVKGICSGIPKSRCTNGIWTAFPITSTTKNPYDRSGLDQKPYRIALAVTQAVAWIVVVALLLGLGCHQTRILTAMASSDKWPPNWDGDEVHNESQPLAPTPVASPSPIAPIDPPPATPTPPA